MLRFLFKRTKTVLQDTAQLTEETSRDRNRSTRDAARSIYAAIRRRGEAAKTGIKEAYLAGAHHPGQCTHLVSFAPETS